MVSTTPLLAVMVGVLALHFFGSDVHIDAKKVWNSVDKCGRSGRVCPRAPAHSDRTCKDGKCGYKCKGPWKDCDYSRMNGCETNVECDPQNCGRCGKRCLAPNPKSMATCEDEECGFKCKRGFKLCSNTCVDTKKDRHNCGSCGTVCNPGDVCRSGRCEPACPAGLGNCDADAGGSCETNLLNDVNNCGSCGNVCPSLVATNPDFFNFNATCDIGVCGVSCTDGRFRDCDGDPSNGCETAINSYLNCGSCGNYCSPLPFAVLTGCDKEELRCRALICDDGRSDADGIFENGCEAVVNP